MDNLIKKSLSNIAKTVSERFGQANNALGNFYKGFAVTPQKVQSFGTGLKSLPPVQWGTTLGKTIAQIPDYYNQQSMANTDLGIANKYTNTAIKLQQQGKTKEAQNLFQKSRELSQGVVSRGQQKQQELGQLKKENITGALKTGLTALAVPSLASTPMMTLGAPALLGGTINKLQGGSFSEGAGRGIGEGLPYAGLSQITSPLINYYGAKVATKLLSNPVVKSTMLRVLAGGTNVLENEIMGKIDGKSPDAFSNFLGFALGATLHNPNQQIRGWQDLPPTTKRLITEGGAKLGLDVTPSKFIHDNPFDNGKPAFLEKRLGQNLDILAEKANMGQATKPIGGNKALLDAEAKKNQMMTPVVTGKARLKVRMKPVEGVPEMQAPKMNLEELNQASGLPPEGLPAQPQQKKSIMSSLYDRFLNESRNKLNQMGPAGQQISKKIDNMYTEAQRQAGSKVADLTKVMKGLDNTGSEDLIKGLRGEKGLGNDNRVKSVREILNKVYADAKAVGLDIGYRENYAPQMVDLDKLKVNREAAINHFIETNQMKPDNAVGFIDDVLNGTDVKEAYNRFGKPLPKKMGNLEFQRVLDWLPDVLRTDKKLLPDYIEQAYSRIAQVKHFGKNNEIGGNLLQNIQKQGYDTKLAQEILDQNLGLTRYDRTMQKASGIIRSVQAAMKLSTGAITNATQSVNTATVGGVRRTLGEIFKYANPAKRAEMSDFALRTGATLNGTMQQIMDQWKGGKTPLEKLIAPFFGNVENFNRIIAANVGRSKALAEGIVDEQALLKAGQEMVDKTQFQVRPIDLPTTWTTPMGKVATQFKSFGFRQANFVKKEILDKAVKGDIRPLARFLLAGTLVNEISNNLKSFINRKERPEDITTRIIEDIPGIGFYQDFVESLAYGIKASSYDKNAIPNAIFDFVAGPTGGDARKALSNAGQALQGNYKPLLKETVKSIPFVGKPFVNENPQIFGGQAKVKLQDIQNKITGKVEAPKQESGQSILEKQKLKDQISELQKQQKAIYNQSGVTIPLAGTFGAMSEQEKIKKMNELESQILALKEQQKIANISIDMPTAPKYTGNTELDKKLTSKYKGQLTTEANDAIKLFEAGKITAQEANKIVSEVKAIQTKLTPKKLKAAPKIKKFAVRKAKISKAKFKVKIPKLTKIKITKPKKFKLSKTPKLTKIKPLAK